MTPPDAPALPSLLERLEASIKLHEAWDAWELGDEPGPGDMLVKDVVALQREAKAEISRLQSALEARTEGRDKLLRVAEDNDGNNDDDEAYEMGKRVGYKQAIQDTESAEQIITDDMINAAFAALPPDAQGTRHNGCR